MGDISKNWVIKSIDEAVHKSEFNEKFVHATLHHLMIVKNNICKKEIKFQYRQGLIDSLLAKLFLTKPDIFPAVRYTSQVDENFDWPISLYPAETFSAKEKFLNIREKDFFECLKVHDVLDCRVAGVLPAEYCLRVIHKHGSTRLLDDLNILITLPRIKFETNFLNKDLVACELIRVAVSHIENKEIKVTLDESSLVAAKNIKLGRLPETSLPQYVLNPTQYADCATLTDFLNLQPQFQNPLLLNSILKSFGYDEKKVCSYYSSFDDMKCSDALTGQALMKEAKNNDLQTCLDKAVDEFNARNITNALDVIQSALEIDDKCKKIYEIRGDIYSDVKKKSTVCKKAQWDFEMAYNLDNNSSSARKAMSKSQFMTAIKFLKNCNYEKAIIAAENALMLDKDNPKVSPFLDYLKNKCPEAFKNVHKEDRLDIENMKNGFSSASETIVKSEPMDH